MIYFIMRKFKIKNSDFPTEYKVEKYTDTLDEANKFLSALSLWIMTQNQMRKATNGEWLKIQ